MSGPTLCAVCGAELKCSENGCSRCLLAGALSCPNPVNREVGLLDDLGIPPEKAVSRAAALASGTSGTMLGRYKLLEVVGEGGFGVVWMAEQRDPIKRRVALKILKLGMDTKQVVARFEAERQALAMMDHPGIAKVLDAGSTETGRPYFVMELVRGTSITDYCDKERFDTRARLDLFAKVCNAIQHAHQKGIIHRDIKPSNILVTLHDGVPVPKVIDFGIAKAMQGELTDKTMFTAFEQFMGTPAYMSPEQAEMSGLDIDTRSDIYSLGVLLYELLTGDPPFDPVELKKAGMEEIRRTIREVEPLKPSSRFSTLSEETQATTASQRRADSRRLVAQLRGDLDWAVMKCLEKDRLRRYQSAGQLADDLSRYIKGRRVEARPVGLVAQITRLLLRNKTVTTTAVIAAVAIFSSAVASYLAVTIALKSLVPTRQTNEPPSAIETVVVAAPVDGANSPTARPQASKPVEIQAILSPNESPASMRSATNSVVHAITKSFQTDLASSNDSKWITNLRIRETITPKYDVATFIAPSPIKVDADLHEELMRRPRPEYAPSESIARRGGFGGVEETEADTVAALFSADENRVTATMQKIERDWRHSGRAVEAIKLFLSDPRVKVRRKAARVLGALHATVTDQQIFQIVVLLSGKTPEEIIDGVKALRGLKAQVAIPHILPLLQHGTPNVVREATRTLGELGDNELVPFIQNLLSNSNGAVQKDARDAITKLLAKPR